MAKAKMTKEETVNEELETEVVDTEEEIDESTALDTLAPNSMPAADPKSKVEYLNQILGHLGTASIEDLSKFSNEVQAQYGKDAAITKVGPGSDSNKSTIKMKPSAAVGSVKEDLEAVFEGQELSEEFKEAATTIFEAALNVRLGLEAAKLEEAYEARLQEEIDVFSESLTKKVDEYLEYVVENWMAENQVAVESSLRNELTEEFIEGLKVLFTEHYIEIPQDKINVLEAMAEKVEALESRLNEVISENAQYKEKEVEALAEAAFEEVSNGMALTQKEKFQQLAEGIDFDGNVETFTKKLEIIKEKMFKPETPATTMINEETFEEEATKPVVPASVGRYVDAISRNVR